MLGLPWGEGKSSKGLKNVLKAWFGPRCRLDLLDPLSTFMIYLPFHWQNRIENTGETICGFRTVYITYYIYSVCMHVCVCVYLNKYAMWWGGKVPQIVFFFFLWIWVVVDAIFVIPSFFCDGVNKIFVSFSIWGTGY